MPKLLIVDDEEKIRYVIKEYSNYSGYETDEAADGLEAIEKVSKEKYDLIILDIMMPKIDGFTTIKEIRKISDIPVIMLSARGEEYDKLYGFDLGIDDYVVKPFSPKELMARINAILARKNKNNISNTIIKYGGLEVDMTGRRVLVDNQEAKLTPKEYELLFYLINNKGIALSREKILSEVWGYDFYGDDRTLDTHIKMLRKNLGKYREYVKTLRSMGYKFEYEEK